MSLTHPIQKIAAALLSVLALATYAIAAEWPPVLQESSDYNGRLADWYEHGALPEWGTANPDQTDEFTVIHPKTEGLVNAPNRPLYVVLHSAGHDLRSCLHCTTIPGNHDIYHAPDDFYALYLDCAKNRDTDWWWGGLMYGEEVNNSNRHKEGGGPSPIDKRVIAEIHWVIEKYQIDENRVYLCGNSMGGSGTLGIGIPHGEIFAAIKANVPAGVRHAAERMYFGQEIPAGVEIPDPPVTIDYSGSNDRWSMGHEDLFNGMRERGYSYIAFWGPFGHVNDNAVLEKVNDLVNRLDWTSIRKDQPYPAFLNATSDQVVPWPSGDGGIPDDAPASQLNGFFRWKNISDTANKTEMALWIASNEETKSVIFDSPTESTADVTCRRLVELRPNPGETIHWTFGAQSGTVQAAQDHSVTIEGLTITQEPVVLTLTK